MQFNTGLESAITFCVSNDYSNLSLHQAAIPLRKDSDRSSAGQKCEEICARVWARPSEKCYLKLCSVIMMHDAVHAAYPCEMYNKFAFLRNAAHIEGISEAKPSIGILVHCKKCLCLHQCLDCLSSHLSRLLQITNASTSIPYYRSRGHHCPGRLKIP